jgi:serine/threonine-protein kinase
MKSIAKYQVIEELGASATGKTYRARDAFRNREFAVKVLHNVPGLTAEAKQKFCGQLATCTELSHRQIAKIQDLGEIEEGIFVATEWRSGMNLQRFMPENRALPLGEKLAVIAQVAEGLAFAHSRGIAHGDLKPGNIFVDPARDVSILDFGIAAWLTALLEAGSRPEGLLANYLAPEQVLGQPFDARSDIFALGLMLYELISGKYPFSADPNLIPREIVHSEAEPLSKLDPQVPKELEQLVARALHKSPEHRLQTAEEFASGLYLAAQQLRRVASAAAQPASSEPAPEPVSDQLAPAFSSLPAAPRFDPPPTPLPAPVPMETPTLQEAAGPPVRERPQDAEPEPRPWTARSYAASTPLSPGANADLPKRPAIPPPTALPPEPDPPPFEPPKSFLQPAVSLPNPVPPAQGQKSGKTAKRALVAAVGLIAAVSIVSSFISRQNLKASQNKRHNVTVVAEPIAPLVKTQAPPSASAPPTHAPKPGESGPDDLGNPEFSARQTLNGPVRSLWESGRYAQAMTLVNLVLANDPSNDDARSWKKKIREAQAAEAALK